MEKSVSDFSDYKECLKLKISELKKNKNGITLKKLSQIIDVQYTYLSKTFNNEESHLSDNHLFRLCKALEFNSLEIDYILTQRSQDISATNDLKEFYSNKIDTLKKEKYFNTEKADSNEISKTEEMNYLFNPMAVIVHVALCIDKYKQNPTLLCDKAGLPLYRLKEILNTLQQIGYITMDDDGISVLEVNQHSIHYPKTHPLMRVHQNILKTSINSRINQTTETEKEGIVVTFSADTKAFEEIKKEFTIFLSKAQEITNKYNNNDSLYQLNFDLFKWF